MGDALCVSMHSASVPALHSRNVLARLYLVRHGEVSNPDHVVYADLPGFQLTQTGRDEAAAAAFQLEAESVDVVVATPLERAVETARPIAAALDAPLQVDDRLTEWRLLQRWAGVVWEDLGKAFPGETEAYLSHPDDLPFTPESITEVAERIASLIDDLGATCPGGAAVLVSHQDPVQAIRLHLTGRPLGELPTDKPDHGTVLTLRADEPWTEIDRWDPPAPGRPAPA